jgi:hypothetical protein
LPEIREEQPKLRHRHYSMSCRTTFGESTEGSTCPHRLRLMTSSCRCRIPTAIRTSKAPSTICTREPAFSTGLACTPWICPAKFSPVSSTLLRTRAGLLEADGLKAGANVRTSAYRLRYYAPLANAQSRFLSRGKITPPALTEAKAYCGTGVLVPNSGTVRVDGLGYAGDPLSLVACGLELR